MGFSVDWVSLKGLSVDEALGRFGLLDAGEEVDYPPRDGFMWGATPNGRVIIATDRYGEFTAEKLAMLSEGVSLVAARAEGNNCTTSIWGYENGQKLWSAACGSEDETDPGDELITSGQLPGAYKRLYAKAAAEHKDGDEVQMHWVALHLASKLTGWGPESEVGSDLKFFRAVSRAPEGRSAAASKGSWLWLLLLLAGVASIIFFRVLRA